MNSAPRILRNVSKWENEKAEFNKLHFVNHECDAHFCTEEVEFIEIETLPGGSDISFQVNIGMP